MGTTKPIECDFGVLLCDVLGFTNDEFVSLLYIEADDKRHTAVWRPATAVTWVATKMPDTADVYFGVSPVSGPARTDAGRGTASDVTRLATLPIDLDIKPKGCKDMDIARTIAAEVGITVGTKPSVTVSTGHGLHAYWPVTDGAINTEFTTAAASALLRRWGRLVAAVAGRHDVHVDNVFDLSRMLRVPGSFNNKQSSS
jgi:hypothetical protein